MKKVILGILVLVFGSVLSANDSSLQFSKKKCENGDSVSCIVHYSLKFQIEKPNIDKLEKECKKENMDSCFELALAYFVGIGVKEDDKKMNKYFNMCCQKDNLIACHFIADYYEMKQNYSKAVELYEANCNKGYVNSCFSLGSLYNDGDKITQDYKKANDYFSKACDGGDFLGCHNLGVAYRDGTGVKQDIQTALKYFDIACDGEVTEGCETLGSLYYLEDYGVKDYKKALNSYQKACDLRSGVSCYMLSAMFARGEGVAQNLAKAVEYLDKACDLGFEAASCHK